MHEIPDIPTSLAAAKAPVMLESPAQVSRAAKAWRRAPALGLDTEFVRERTYFANLGLVQISDGQTVWLLDPLVDGTLPPLKDLLEDRKVGKILHSPSEDLEVLWKTVGAVPDPLIDTQLACAMLGQTLQMGYHMAAEWLLDVKVDKDQTRSNWCRRPLAPAQLHYAALDVCLLPMMWNLLHEGLQDKGRLEWFEQDCADKVAAAREPLHPGDAWFKIKGLGKLDGQSMAIIRSLATWREKEARRRNQPRGFITPDRVLMEIASGKLSQIQEYESIADFHPRARQRYGRAMADMTTNVLDSGKSLPVIPQLDLAQRNELKKLRKAIGNLAQEMGLEPALLAARRDLEQLVLGRDPQRLTGWRGELLKGLEPADPT
jgi:ribonuclease D